MKASKNQSELTAIPGNQEELLDQAVKAMFIDFDYAKVREIDELVERRASLKAVTSCKPYQSHSEQ